MATSAQQNEWSLALEKERNAANRSSAAQNQNNAPQGSPPTDGISSSLQTATLQLVRILVTSSIPTFGFTWILLTIYTAFKDLVNFKFMADPGDAVFIFLPAKAVAALPESIKSLPRLASRIFIYPIGLMLMTIYGALFLLLLMLVYALLDPVGVIAKLLGF